MTLLDPRFSKVVALMRSTQHAGEQKAARSRAEAMAVAAGMTLEEALAVDAVPKSEWFFDIFDREEDAADRSWKAEQAARRRVKIVAWTIRRAALIAKYGSIDAATAPCERERLILAAVARWRTVRDNPRWTHALDGWTGWALAARQEVPAHVIEAIEQAYPLPTTFAQAKAEHNYWTERNQELEDAFSEDGDSLGDNELDLPTAIRADIVRALVEHELPVTTLADLHARFAMYRESKSNDDRVEAALFRDIGAMALRESQVSNVTTTSAPLPVHEAGRIENFLKAHPDWSDRRIARAGGCSPTTVGKIRRAIGAMCSDRSVQRGGQVYTVHFGSAATKPMAFRCDD